MEQGVPGHLFPAAEKRNRDGNEGVDTGCQVECEATQKDAEQGKEKSCFRPETTGAGPWRGFFCKEQIPIVQGHQGIRRYQVDGERDGDLFRHSTPGSFTGLIREMALDDALPQGSLLLDPEGSPDQYLPG